MNVTAALAEIARHRTNEIVVTTMGATREWSRLSNSPLDFHYLPSAMGHAPMIALGLALAGPHRDVIVFNGDGSLLMSLGCLVTIAASGVKNISMILLDNGVYEVTGGQRTAASQTNLNYTAMAQAAGFPTACEFAELENWKNTLPSLFKAEGPRFFCLRVDPVSQDVVPKLDRSFSNRIAAFRQAIQLEG